MDVVKLFGMPIGRSYAVVGTRVIVACRAVERIDLGTCQIVHALAGGAIDPIGAPGMLVGPGRVAVFNVLLDHLEDRVGLDKVMRIDRQAVAVDFAAWDLLRIEVAAAI